MNMKFSNVKVKNKLIIMTIFCVFIVWLSMAIVSTNGINKIYDQKVEQIINQTVDQTSKYVNTELTNIVKMTHYAIASNNIQEGLKLEASANNYDYIIAESLISATLTQLQIQNKMVDSVAMVVNNNWIYGYNYKMDYDSTDLIKKAEEHGLIYWSPVKYLNKSTGKYVLPVALHIPNGDYSIEKKAYMIVNINANLLQDNLNQLAQSMDCDIVMNNDQHIILGSESFDPFNQNDDYIINEKNIEINNWKLTSAIKPEVLYLDRDRTVKNMFIISLVIALLCMFIAFLMSKSISEPLKILSNQVKNIEYGNFDKLEYEFGENEIGKLAQCLNHMSVELEKYVKMLEDEKEQVKLVEEQKRKAEISVLQEQINPHFIYNTLDSLYWYALSGKKEEIAQIVVDLATFLRISLSKGNEIILLENELKHVENYLKIEKTIFHEKFNYKILCEDSIKQLHIVKILLQPLVENCLNHGFADMEIDGEIIVELTNHNEFVKISVIDNGCGISCSKDNPKKYSGFALENVTKRLKLHYGDDAIFKIESEPYKKTEVIIFIRRDKMI